MIFLMKFFLKLKIIINENRSELSFLKLILK